MKDLDLVKETFIKYKIKFHELVEDKSTYIMPFKDGDINGHIFINGYGLIPLTKSGQFINYMEFYNGDIASY